MLIKSFKLDIENRWDTTSFEAKVQLADLNQKIEFVWRCCRSRRILYMIGFYLIVLLRMQTTLILVVWIKLRNKIFHFILTSIENEYWGYKVIFQNFKHLIIKILSIFQMPDNYCQVQKSQQQSLNKNNTQHECRKRQLISFDTSLFFSYQHKHLPLNWEK